MRAASLNGPPAPMSNIGGGQKDHRVAHDGGNMRKGPEEEQRSRGVVAYACRPNLIASAWSTRHAQPLAR
jgi:hypothetical protein